mgnify:CR=1 FL=1
MPAHPLWGLVWWHQRASEGISASLWGLVWGLVRDVRKLYSTLAGGNQWQSVAISGNQRT